MTLRCVLLPTGPDVDVVPRLTAARALCRSVDAHMEVLFVSPDPRALIQAMPEVIVAAGASIASLELEYRTAAATTRKSLESWCAANGLPGSRPDDYRLDTTYVSLSERTGDVEDVVAMEGRLSDLIVVDRPDSSDVLASRIFDAAVFSTGRPVLVVPPKEHLHGDLLRKVMIAWNGSLEGARAVKQSLDLLRNADEVVIFTSEGRRSLGNAAADLADYLRWHGIVARHVPTPPHMPSVGSALLAAAENARATMILAGAYTHSRIREFFLGGVTRHLLDHATVPLLMAH